MKARRLSFYVDKTVLFTCDNDNRHRQACVLPAQGKGAWDHQSRLGSTRADL